MSMKLENVEIAKLLPPWMRQDEANAALSRSASSLFQEPAKRIKQLRIWDKIDELDDEMLDELAWELNIDWYSSAMEISKKKSNHQSGTLDHGKAWHKMGCRTAYIRVLRHRICQRMV